MRVSVLRCDTVGSTNTEALEHARRGVEEGFCVTARRQTEGRGRNGRKWESPPDAGLYLSIVLRPSLEPRLLPLITLMAGVAVFDAVAGFGLKPDIKWVNDVLVGDRKIAGILAEATETAKGTAVVLGIGVNLRSSRLPGEVADSAASIESETGRVVRPEEIESSLVGFIIQFYDVLNGPDGPERIVSEWRRRSSYFSGKAVAVSLGGETIEGVTDGLEPDGALRLRTADGRVEVVHAGDVRRLRRKLEH